MFVYAGVCLVIEAVYPEPQTLNSFRFQGCFGQMLLGHGWHGAVLTVDFWDSFILRDPYKVS